MWQSMFTRMARKMQASIDRPMIAATLDYGDSVQVHTRTLCTNPGEAEFMAKAILSDIERTISNPAACRCCADRLIRVRAALAILEPGATEPLTPPIDRAALH